MYLTGSSFSSFQIMAYYNALCVISKGVVWTRVIINMEGTTVYFYGFSLVFSVIMTRQKTGEKKVGKRTVPQLVLYLSASPKKDPYSATLTTFCDMRFCATLSEMMNDNYELCFMGVDTNIVKTISHSPL